MSHLSLLRLVLASERRARTRQIGIVGGIAVGIALALLLLAGAGGIAERSQRGSWAQPPLGEAVELQPGGPALGAHQVGVATTHLPYRGHLVEVIYLTLPDHPRLAGPDGLRLPGPGQFLTSPALAALTQEASAPEFADRFGTLAGHLPAAALTGPDSLVALVGVSRAQLDSFRFASGPHLLTEFRGNAYASDAYRYLALLGAAAVLLPVFLFIAIVTNLGAAKRAETFATLRLLGVGPRRLARLTAGEMTLLAGLGGLAGLALYRLVVPLAARVRIEDTRFYSADLLMPAHTALGVVLGTVAAAAAVAWWRTRRAALGSLGAVRERDERPPRWWSLVPLGAGLGLFALVASRLLPLPPGPALLAGTVLTMVGLLVAGPLLTHLTATRLRHLARTGATLVAAGRIARHPRAVFRSVAGLVVALYALTMFTVGMTSVKQVPAEGLGTGAPAPRALRVALTEPDPGLQAALAAEPAVAYVGLLVDDGAGKLVTDRQTAEHFGIAADLAPEVQWVRLDHRWLTGRPTVAEAAAHPPHATGFQTLLVEPAAGPQSLEIARTSVMRHAAFLPELPYAPRDYALLTANAPEYQFQTLGYLGMLVAGLISALSLGMSTTVAVLERQRSFGLLRLAGMPRQRLQRAVTWEAVLPVATMLLGTLGAGIFSAWAAITGLSERQLAWPAASNYLVLAACLSLLALAVGASRRAAGRIGATATRFE